MTPSDPAPRWGIALALLAVYLIWGSTYYAIRVAIDTLPPFLMAGGRFVAAGVVLYGFARWRGAEPPAIRFWPRAGLVGGLMLLGGNGGVCWAETRVPSGLASLIIGSVPLWTVLLDWLRPGGRRPSAAVAAGVVAGFAGIAWLVRPGGTGA
ncbi:MAG: EamA family transporter, partial [Candidatus Brocadiae bacterium]|nr:EamA family transporter [Candidatus Brocadiia bacterium]